jgi:hypothetical protein
LFSCHGVAVVAGPEDRHWLFCFRSIREEEFDLVERSMRRERKNNVGAFFSSFFTEPARMELGVLEVCMFLVCFAMPLDCCFRGFLFSDYS